MAERLETAPKMDLAIADMAHVVEELRASHAIYRPLFQRREPRDAAPVYPQGLLAALPRTSIRPVGLAVEGLAPHAVRAMQSVISAGKWADERLLPSTGKQWSGTWVPTTGSSWSPAVMFPSKASLRLG